MTDRTSPADELMAAVRQLRPSSPAVAAHTVAVRLHPRVVDAVADLLERQGRIAAEVEQHLGEEFQDGALDQTVHDALAVARAVLDRPEPAEPAPADEDRRQRYARAIWESTGLQPWEEAPHIWREDTEEEAAAVMAVADAETAQLRQQLADAQTRAAQADELSRIAHQCSNDAEAARQAAVQRAERAEARARTLEHVARGNKRHVQHLVPELERAEAALDRVRALAERWRHTGDRKNTALPELLAALDTDRSQP